MSISCSLLMGIKYSALNFERNSMPLRTSFEEQCICHKMIYVLQKSQIQRIQLKPSFASSNACLIALCGFKKGNRRLKLLQNLFTPRQSRVKVRKYCELRTVLIDEFWLGDTSDELRTDLELRDEYASTTSMGFRSSNSSTS